MGAGNFRKTCKRYNIPWNAHELTFSCYQRRAFLGKDMTRQLLAGAVCQAREKHAFDVWAHVVMPEHAHLLIWPTAEVYSISVLLQSIKQSVSRKAINYLRRQNPDGLKWLATGQKHSPYRFWQDGGGYDRNITAAETLWGVITYIHNNPVRRGLVSTPGEWPWSSYNDWEGLGAGPIPINKESLQQAIR